MQCRKSALFQDYIGGLNWGYKVELRDKAVKYINAYGYIQDGHTIKCTNKRGKEEIITTDKILIATGERPRYPDIPGVEHCISSDDLFSLQEVLEHETFSQKKVQRFCAIFRYFIVFFKLLKCLK